MRISDWSSDVCSSDLVIVPNQRGYGNSSRPTEVTDYGIEHLAGDLIALLDHYGYDDATFVGHDWGAFVVWGLTLLHPDRVNKVINLSLPYQDRGEQPWIEFMEAVLGGDFYRSEEHTSELQSLMRISYAVFCLKKKNKVRHSNYTDTHEL